MTSLNIHQITNKIGGMCLKLAYCDSLKALQAWERDELSQKMQ